MKLIVAIMILALEALYAVETTTQDNKALSIQKIEEQENIGYRYIKLSDQWVLFPGLGIGYRSHRENSFHGYDIDLTAYSYWDAGFSLYGKSHYLFYPNQKNFYLGVGAGVIGGWFSAGFQGTPLIRGTFGDGPFIKPTLEVVLGYEWQIEQRHIFLQFEMGGSYGAVPLYPSLSLGMGF